MNPKIGLLNKDFSKEMMDKLNVDKVEFNKENMNLSEIIKPTFGVEYLEGTVKNKGPDYMDKLPQKKLSLKEYSN